MGWIIFLLALLIVVVSTPPEKREGALKRVVFAWVFVSVIGGAVVLLLLKKEGDDERAKAVAEAAPTPAPAPRTEAQARAEAIRLYPQIAVAGSPMNLAFRSRVDACRRSRPELFRDSEWPLIVAREVAGAPLSDGTPRAANAPQDGDSWMWKRTPLDIPPAGAPRGR